MQAGKQRAHMRYISCMRPAKVAATLQAGFLLDRLVRPGSGIVAVGQLVERHSSWLPWARVRSYAPRRPLLTGGRMSWVRELVGQVGQQGG